MRVTATLSHSAARTGNRPLFSRASGRPIATVVTVVTPLVAGLLVAGTGCSTPPKAPATAAPARSAPLETTTAAAVADQAERDIETLLALRRGSGDAPPSSTGLSQAAPAASDPSTIIWNNLPPIRATSPHRPADRNSRRASGRTGTRADDPAADPAGDRPGGEQESTSLASEALTEAGPLATDEARPQEALAVEPTSMLLVRLRQDLYRASIDSNQPLRELLAIASMALVDPELELPSGSERHLSPDELELLEQLHTFYKGLGRDLTADNPADETLMNAIDDLHRAVDRTPELRLPTVAFCWRIGGFGDYDEFDRAAFLAHSDKKFILYLEIEGFTSEQNGGGQWVTEISQQLEIYSDRDGIPVWSEPWQNAVDVTSKTRRDFFTTQLIALPPALSVGKYHLKIRVRDEHSGAEAEDSVPFEMVADPKLAATIGKRMNR